jgi:hypothetical protein
MASVLSFIVDCKPGQIMAHFFATTGELTVLVSYVPQEQMR